MNDLFVRLSLFVMLFSTVYSSVEAKGDRKPNIIYILADDMGYGDCSLYGQKLFSTPNIDRIGLEGILFTDHYASSAVCAPTRCSLMTGKHQGHASIRGNFSLLTGERIGLSSDEVIIPELLKNEGYTTGIFGKWGIGEEGTSHTPTQRGFDEWFGYINQKDAHNHYPAFLHHNMDRIVISENEEGQKQRYSLDMFTDHAKAFIKSNASEGNPFFLYLAYTIPHAELEVPEEELKNWWHTFEKDEVPYHDNNIPGRVVERPKAVYAAMMTRMDRQIGEILDLVKAMGIDSNTIIMFSSDNGPHSEDGHSRKYFNCSGGLRGGKRDLYEGGIRVPFMVRWPEKIEPGRRSSVPSAQYDVMPTICDLLGIPLPENCDGISFLPTLFGKRQKRIHDYLYWEYVHKEQARQAARFGSVKAVRYGLDKLVEIFDLSSDPEEKINLAGERPLLVEKALNIFEAAHIGNSEFPLKKGE